MVGASRRPYPIGGRADGVGVVDLQDLGGVLDDEAGGIDEVGKDIVARAVSSHTPAYGMAMVDHAARAAHDGLAVRHHEGDVVHAVDAAIGQHDSVVIVVAAQECHHLRAVREAEAERPLKEGAGRFNVGAVEVDMREAQRKAPASLTNRVQRSRRRRGAGCSLPACEE